MYPTVFGIPRGESPANSVATSVPQTIYPDGDLVAGTWVTAPLWSKTDDQTTADFIEWTTGDSALSMSTTNFTRPVSNSGWVFNVHAMGQLALTNPEFSLYYGASKIEGFVPILQANTPALFQLALSAAAVAGILDGNDVRFNVETGTAITKFDTVTLFGWWLTTP